MCTLWLKHLSRVAVACRVFHAVHKYMLLEIPQEGPAIWNKVFDRKGTVATAGLFFFSLTHLCRLSGCKNTKGTRENDLMLPFTHITAHHCNILSSIVAISNSFPRWRFSFFSLLCSFPRGCSAQPTPDTHTDITESHQHQRRFLLPLCLECSTVTLKLHLWLAKTSNLTTARDSDCPILSAHSLILLADKAFKIHIEKYDLYIKIILNVVIMLESFLEIPGITSK